MHQEGRSGGASLRNSVWSELAQPNRRVWLFAKGDGETSMSGRTCGRCRVKILRLRRLSYRWLPMT